MWSWIQTVAAVQIRQKKWNPKCIPWCEGNVTSFNVSASPECSSIQFNWSSVARNEATGTISVLFLIYSPSINPVIWGGIRGMENEHQQSCPPLNFLTEPNPLHKNRFLKGGKKTTTPHYSFEGLRSIQMHQMLAGPMAAEHEREVEVEVVGCARLERWSLLITMSLPITQTGLRPVILKCAA